jgi:hypothetical protein
MVKNQEEFFVVIFKPNWSMCTMCNGQTNALVCNKKLIQMSHIKTLKITPTCFDHQMIIIRELFDAKRMNVCCRTTTLQASNFNQ